MAEEAGPQVRGYSRERFREVILWLVLWLPTQKTVRLSDVFLVGRFADVQNDLDCREGGEKRLLLDDHGGTFASLSVTRHRGEPDTPNFTLR